jgi:hypothetical protein
MISDYKKLILSIRMQNIEKNDKNLPIIEEQMEESFSEITRKSEKDKNMEKTTKDKSIAQKRK